MKNVLQQSTETFSQPSRIIRVKLLASFLLILALLVGGIVTLQVPKTRLHASAGTHPDPTTFASPYGFTLRGKVNQTLVSEYAQLNVHWVRDQVLWKTIETSPGVYKWSSLDQQVQLANLNGIHIDFAIQAAPSWHLNLNCGGKHTVFGAADVASFATVLANRYNGLNGFGYIDAYEIGNEEFAANGCKSGSVYAPVLQAGYQAIKAQSPNALVGMFGFLPQSKSFLQQFMTGMYTFPGIQNYFDYANFHYYSDYDPMQEAPGGNKNFPTFHEKWQLMHSIMAANGDGNKPIWVTETGWDNSNPQLQSQAMQEVFDDARQSGVVQKVFWFSINWDKTFDINPGDLTPGMPPQPAYYLYQSYVQQYPLWSGTLPTPPTPSPTSIPITPYTILGTVYACSSNSCGPTPNACVNLYNAANNTLVAVTSASAIGASYTFDQVQLASFVLTANAGSNCPGSGSTCYQATTGSMAGVAGGNIQVDLVMKPC